MEYIPSNHKPNRHADKIGSYDLLNIYCFFVDIRMFIFNVSPSLHHGCLEFLFIYLIYMTSSLILNAETFILYFKIFYCGSQNHIQSTYIYTYSLSPEVSRNTNLIIAQFICNTVQRQGSSIRQIITLTYKMFISTNHFMCTLCHITDRDDTGYHTILTTL